MSDAGIRIEPTQGDRPQNAVYATFQLRNTADARVTQAGCLTNPADVPSAYCYFEITATIPEPSIYIGLIMGSFMLVLFGGRRAR